MTNSITSPKPTSHRTSIDGLRTFAVLSVMAFHFGVPMYGGFIGVDAFFVLSGFLITSLLLKDLSNHGRIFLGTFWVRRIRRLIPVMVVMVITVVIFATLRSLLPEKISLASDVTATLTYVANWYFISHSSYFANDDTVSPLLHMWSLAVEEQFYIFWPIAFSLIAKFAKGNKARFIAWLSIAISLTSAFWMAYLWDPQSPERAYMGTDSRAFQLAIGSGLAALIALRPKLIGTFRSRTIVGTTGFIALGVGCLTLGSKIGPTTFYARGGAFLVGLFAAAVIWSLWSGPSRISPILEFRPIAYLGRISYSMYLWHWPIAVFLIPLLPKFSVHNRIAQPLILTLLTIAISALSYHLVEKPLRIRGAVSTWKKLFVLTTTPIVLFVVVVTSNHILLRSPEVNPGTSNAKVIMLVGDSVPLRLSSQFEAYATTKGWHVVSAAKGSCPATTRAMVDPSGVEFGSTKDCAAVHQKQQVLMQKFHPSAIIWMSRYEIADALSSDNKHLTPDSPDFWQLSSQDLTREVSFLTKSNAQITFVPIEPSGTGMLSRCITSKCNWFLKRLISPVGVGYQDKWNQLLLAQTQSNSNTHYFSITKSVCRNTRNPCNDKISGKLARPDGTHYTPAGASQFIPALVDFAILQATQK